MRWFAYFRKKQTNKFVRKFKIKQMLFDQYENSVFFIFEKKDLFYKKATGKLSGAYSKFSFAVDQIKTHTSGSIHITGKWIEEKKVLSDQKTDPS